LAAVERIAQGEPWPPDEVATLAALAAGGVGLWSWDLASDAIRADSVARRLWGVPDEGALHPGSILSRLHDDDVERFTQAIAGARVSGSIGDLIVRIVAAGEEDRWLRVRGQTRLHRGRRELIGVTLDVSDRVRTEAALRATQTRLEQAQDAGGTHPFEWDAERDVIIAAPAFFELFGVPPGARFGLAEFLARVHPEDRERVAADQRLIPQTGSAFESEYRLLRPDGDVRWLLARGEGVREPGRSGIAGVVMDITARKAMEVELRRSKREARARFRELKALYQNAPVGLALLDRGLRFKRINEFLASLTLLPADEHRGRRIFDLLPDLRAGLEPLLEVVLKTGKPLRNVAIEGATAGDPELRRWWRAHLYALPDESGSTTGIGLVAEDITAQRRAEQARDLLGRELSHRIKNMFAVIVSLINLSARGRPEAREFAEIVRGRVEALGRAHDVVRPSGRVESGPDGPRLQALLATLLTPYRDEASESRIRLSGDDARIGPHAATALALALHEFATNASKYGALSSSEGHVAIESRCAEDRFTLIWQERGGPAVTGPPDKLGFGSTLARRTIAGEIGGTVEPSWDAAGLTIRIEAPLARLEE
jgi:PAS domain S-box-containing protein